MATPPRTFPNSLLSVLTEHSYEDKSGSNGPETPISLHGPFQTKSNKNRHLEIAARKMVLEMRANVNQKASELRRLAVTNVITSGFSQDFLNTNLCDLLAEMGNPESIEDLVSRMPQPSNKSTPMPSSMPSKLPKISKVSKISQASTISASSVESLYGTPSSYARPGKSSLFNRFGSMKPLTVNNSNTASSSSSSGTPQRLGPPTLGYGLNGQRVLRYPRENSVVPKSRMLPMTKPGDVLKSAPRTQGLKRTSSSQSVQSLYVTPNPRAIKKPVRLKVPTGGGNFFHVDMNFVGIGNNTDIKNFDAFVADVHDLISKRNTTQARTKIPTVTNPQPTVKNPRKYIKMDSEQAGQYRQPNNHAK